MGCAQSTIGEDSVSRCKERKLLMKQAIVFRTAYAAANSAYAAALMSTGLALSSYAHGEAAAAEASEISTVALPELSAPKRDVLKSDSFSIEKDDAVLEESVKARQTKQKRGVSMSEDDAVLVGSLSVRETKPKHGVSASNDDVSEESAKATETKQNALPIPVWDYFSMNLPETGITDTDEEEDEELEFRTPDNMSKMEVSDDEEEEVETPLPKQSMQSNIASDETRRASNANWLKALKEIADQFLKASECAQEFSRLLEPNRYRFHRSVADNRVDTAARVMRVITWNLSGDVVNRNDDFDAKENEPLVVALDKLLVWEKKLYDEVKAGKLVKLEYQRKLILLANQKRRGASSELLMKTKAVVRHLHTRYIVEMQMIESTVSEINNLRDFQLYPKLVELLDGMTNMWEKMFTHHENQLRIATNLKSLNVSAVHGETTWDHYQQTTKLLSVLVVLQIQFEKLIAHQKSFISTVHNWLNLSLIPLRHNLKEKLSSSKTLNPPIQLLLYSWNKDIQLLIPNEPAQTAISSFLASMETIILLQEEEMKLKEKCEETRKEYLWKKQAFEQWLLKHSNKRSSNMDIVGKYPVPDRQVVVQSLKKQLDEEMEVHVKHCVRVRAKSVRSLKTRLPELFKAMADYAHACALTYSRLMCIALSQDPTNVNGETS